MRLCDLKNVSISSLAGVGPQAQKAYAALGVQSVADLITLLPRGYEDKSSLVPIGFQRPGQAVNTRVEIISKSFFGKGLKSIKIIVRDLESQVRANLLGFNRAYLDKTVFEGCCYSLYGEPMPDTGRGPLSFSAFELRRISEDEDFSTGISEGFVPVYPLSGCLRQRQIRRDIQNALSRCDELEDDLPLYIRQRYGLEDRDRAVRDLHNPKSADDIVNARKALAFSEVFYLLLASQRQTLSRRRSIPKKVYDIERTFIQSLPFSLTSDQIRVLDEIRCDMSSDRSMNRLLQGDVGAGKTVVALISALHAISEGFQVALMAPTELLSRQHAASCARLLDGMGINIAYLDGQVASKARKSVLENLENGNIDLIIGTHALFSKDVRYRNLGLVIIDEQHRFGVKQRASLAQKGNSPDLLLMTATPIPRTLAMTLYGNLNVSTIRTKPEGRLPIKTFTVDSEHRDAMFKAVRTELERGHQAYFVCPRIESEDDESSLKDVYSLYQYLCDIYGDFKGQVIHSKLEDDQKMRILEDFASHKTGFLVATSVVEVGLDVRDATCMVIMHSQTFGLSALHQLRGRVGRSSLQSWCFLSHDGDLSDDARKRLSVLKRSDDGFEIAEEDLRIRGPGEFSGLRQSGFANLKYASLDEDLETFSCARKEASAILERDPGLIMPEHYQIRMTLMEMT